MTWWMTLLLIFSALLGLFATGLPIFACFLILNVASVLFLMGSGGLGLFVNSMTETVTAEALTENIRALTDAVNKAKPSGAKGTYLKRIAVTSTQGPGVRVDPASLSAS